LHNKYTEMSYETLNWLEGYCWRVLENTPDITEEAVRQLQNHLKQAKRDFITWRLSNEGQH
jgi:hypothetical protein